MHASSDKILWKRYDISQSQLTKTYISKAKQKRLILVSHSFGGMIMEKVRLLVGVMVRTSQTTGLIWTRLEQKWRVAPKSYSRDGERSTDFGDWINLAQ